MGINFIWDKNQSKEKVKKNGFALIFILVFIAMIMGIVADIIYQTQVGTKITLDEKNIIDAQAAAKTGYEFAKVLLKLNAISEKYQNNPILPLPKEMYKVLNGYPIGTSSFKNMEGFIGNKNISDLISPELLSALKVMPGYFVLNITPENSKLNVNLFQSRYYSLSRKIFLRLFSTENGKKLLQFSDYTPEKIVDNLGSYIKTQPDNVLQIITQSAYDSVGARYQPKHAALESLEELRRIPGFNFDNIYNVYSPYLTIWPINGNLNTLNINSAPTELIATLMTPIGQEIQDIEWDKFDDYRVQKRFERANLLNWFQANISSYSNDQDSREIAEQLFGDKDNIFRIESTGVVNGIKQKWVVILQTSHEFPLTNSNQKMEESEIAPSSENSVKINVKTSEKNSDFKILHSDWEY